MELKPTVLVLAASWIDGREEEAEDVKDEKDEDEAAGSMFGFSSG